jgi:hypothetical protein
VGDLLKWNDNITSGKLHASIFQLMQKPGSLTDGRPINYGFGLFLYHFQGLDEISHSGATAGYRAWLGRIPARGLSIAVICNAASADATGLARQIANLYLGAAKPDQPQVAVQHDLKPGLYRSVRDHSTITVDTTNLRAGARFEGGRMIISDPVYGDDVWELVEHSIATNLSEFVGVYASEEAESVLRVVVENGNLAIHRRPISSFALKPTYADAFYCSLGNVRFVRDATQKIVALSLSGPRVWDLRFTRDDSGNPAALK